MLTLPDGGRMVHSETRTVHASLSPLPNGRRRCKWGGPWPLQLPDGATPLAQCPINHGDVLVRAPVLATDARSPHRPPPTDCPQRPPAKWAFRRLCP